MPALFAVTLLVPLLAGCVNTPKDELAAQSLETTASSGPAPASLPPRPVKTPLDATASVSQVWVKPNEPVTLSATSDKASAFAWYVQLRPAPITSGNSTASGGHHAMLPASMDDSLRMGPGPGESAPPPKPKPVLDTKNIEAGASKSLQFPEAALYRLHCRPHPFMKVNVTVRDDAPPGDPTVTILDGAKLDEYRYSPEEIAIRPGAKVTFQNAGRQMHTATQEAFLAPAGTGRTVAYTPRDAGDYDVVLLATNANGGFGEARARLLVDASKPDELQPVGPYKGEFQHGVDGAPDPASKTFTFTSQYAIKAIEFDVTSKSQTPAPASVRVALRPPGGEAIATAATDAQGKARLVAEGLPAGAYELVVTAATGILIQYEARGLALVELVPPAAAETTASGG